MWTDAARAQYARADLALPSDLTDAKWALLEPFFPPPSHVGQPRKRPLRRIVEAILYLLRGARHDGCCRHVFHRSRQYDAGFTCGGTTGCGCH